MNIGPLSLASNLFLSPLAGYTTLPFRLTLRELGGLGLATTDLVNARSLIEKNPKALQILETRPTDQPLAVQLFGSNPAEMREAARIVEGMGFPAVDINMGCPVRKVCKVGGGSAMLTDLARTADLARGMVEAVRIPVTAKMRLGWDEDNLTAPELAQALEAAGLAAVFIHGRTREQGFTGRVNLEGIRAVVQAVKRIPVIGNGDVVTPQAAKMMLEATGCAGVSVGRGAFTNPWIFQQTLEHLKTGALPPEPDFEARVALMLGHLDRMIEVYGEEHGCKTFRKIAPCYARRFGPASKFIKKVVLFSTRAEFLEILEYYRHWRLQFLDSTGALKPKYQPIPLVASFMRPTGTTVLTENDPDGMPEPQGPSEWW